MDHTQTDNHVSGFDPNHLIAWKTAPAGTEPPGWEWVWELEFTMNQLDELVTSR